MTRSQRLALHYIRAIDLCAVYVASAGNKVQIGITRAPATKARALKRGRAKMVSVVWLPRAAFAAALADAALTILAGKPASFVTPNAAVAAVVSAAHSLGMALTSDATVAGRVSQVITDIDRRVDAMQASGHLRGLNADYRAARAEASRRGVPIMTYGEYLARYKIKMAYEIGRALR